MHTQVDVQVRKIENDHFADYVTAVCNFCGGMEHLDFEMFATYKKMGHDLFFCPFCIRHNFHQVKNKSILLLDFKGIIGYYYYILYLNKRLLWLGKILDYINEHKYVGLENAALSYNEDRLLWFADFKKIGKSKNKMCVQFLINTIQDIIDVFELPDLVRLFEPNLLFEKYEEAIETFYHHRTRPAGRRILSPSLWYCNGIFPLDVDLDKVKNINLFSLKTD